VGRAQGVSDEQLAEVSGWRDSAVFDPLDRAVMEYAERMTETPVDIPESLFNTLRNQLDDAQLVELTGALAWENFRARFNHAFGIESEGYYEGAFCLTEERHPPAPLGV
jgi:alkylhydroperoxidase family enzyme